MATNRSNNSVKNRGKKQPEKETARIPWALIGAIAFGGLAVLILYIMIFRPEEGMLSGLRGVMTGLGGNLYVLFPLVCVWLCVVCACAAAGRKVSPWRMCANFLLVICFYSAVELFFLEGVERENSVILGWADFVVKAFRYGKGGGALGALAAAALYGYLGKWGGLITLIVIATILLAATGKLAKIAQTVKKTSHDAEQRRLVRRNDDMFEPDSMLDDDIERRAPRRPQPRERDSAGTGRPAPRRKMYNEKISTAPEAPRPAARGEKPLNRAADAPAETPAATKEMPEARPEQETRESGRRARAEYVPGAKARPSAMAPDKQGKEPAVREQISIDDLRIEPDEYETDEPEKPDRLRDVAPGLPIGRLRHEPEPVAEEIEYNYPPIDLLNTGSTGASALDNDADLEKARRLEDTLKSFGIQTKLTGIAHGPAVTRFELQPAPGVKVSRITALADDIALNLAALRVRIEAPIPGKAAVGVEIPNDHVETVALRDVLESGDARRHVSRVAVGLGKDNSGRYIVADIAKMPHVLIAGQTGSGKSVCINSIIVSILYRATPEDVKMILIDPKVVELSVYNGIPHLIAPVVTDPKKAASALEWAVVEMTGRYKKFSERNVRDIKGYNKALKPGEEKMPQIVIIIDELADLMMVAPGEVEDSVCRLAQLARAAGMHLVIATQRPSVNVITGIIKANIPTRIAFLVASQVDSRTIIDHGGAEKLLGNGDMLFVPAGIQKPMRVQGAWVSDEEVNAVVNYVKERHEAEYDEDVLEHINNAVLSDAEKEEASEEYDPRLPEAVEIVMEAGQASISMLQRRMRVGYARAGRLIDDMYARGIVSEADGAKPRAVLITREQYERMFENDDQ